MAVGSKNKIKGKNIKNKRKKEAINELINSLEDLIKLKEQETLKKHKKPIILYILPTLLLCIVIYLLFPKINLSGDKVVTISYHDKYQEAGYKSTYLLKNNTNDLKINSNLKENKVGKYTITYYVDYKLFKITKERIINIVDDIPPSIKIDSNPLKICPKEEINNLKFEAIDEYDGDLSNKVIKELNDDILSLSVKDNSNNLYKTEVNIIREDTESPSITLKGNNPMHLNIGVSYNEPGYEAIDNCDGDLTDKVTVNGTVSTRAGTYKLTYTVEDETGNKAEVVRTVIVRSPYLYNNGTIGTGTIYLTFDDGPKEGTTNIILDILKEEGIKATFFVTCNGPDYLIKRIVDEGHTIALHTATHDYQYVYSSVDNYFADLNRVSNRVKNITGIESKIIRFPGGSSNTISRHYQQGIMSTLTGMVLDKGYRYYDWNVDSNDAGGANYRSQVYSNVVNNLRYNRGNVVLMHDVKYQTRDALRDIIKFGKENNFKFDKITMNTYMVRHSVQN